MNYAPTIETIHTPVSPAQSELESLRMKIVAELVDMDKAELIFALDGVRSIKLDRRHSA